MPAIQIFTLINAAVSGYFIYSQKTLYKQHLDKGCEKVPMFFQERKSYFQQFQNE